jgi:hypothetical protein
MSVIKTQAFGGMLPAVDDRQLPDASAAFAQDTFLYSGALIGWRKPTQTFVLTSPTTRKVVRVPRSLANIQVVDLLHLSYWAEFDDPDTDGLRSPVVNDTFGRYYFASPSLPPRYNDTDRIAAALPHWLLGVPAPANAPTVSPAGGTGTGIATSRAYLYTYVTNYSEESAPSPALVQNGYEDDTWAITVTAPDAADMGTNRNITNINIYRTVTGTNGVASYFLVTTISASGSLAYNDSLTDDIVAENVELPSTTWSQPPADLQGIVMGHNGMMVGFRSNEVWFSEPFRPHAWPAVYTITTEYPIVGLGVTGDAIVVCTMGHPYILHGVNPSAISNTKCEKAEPCLSRGSIVSGVDGVFYISANGLIKVSSYGEVANVTETWITREKWVTLIPKSGTTMASSARAARLGAAYFAFGSVFFNYNTSVEDSSEATDGFSVDTVTAYPQTRFCKMSSPDALPIFNVWTDPWTGVPMIIQDGKVWFYNFSDTAPALMPYTWKSKIFQQPSKKNFEVMRVWFEVPTGTTPQNGTRNTDVVQTLAADQYGIVRAYGDGNLVTTREIRNSGELLRVNSGQKYEFWQFEFEARVRIIGFQAATNVKELGSV